MTLNWVHKSNRTIGDLLPDGVVYRASKAFVAWPERDSDTPDDTMGEALSAAARELLI